MFTSHSHNKKKSDILHLSLLSCCLEHRCQMFAVTTHPALSFSPTHTHTPPHILQHLENGSSRFQHSKQLTMTCLLLAQFCCIFCSPSSLPVFQAAVTAPPFVSGTHTHKCVLTPLRVEVMLAAGGHHEKTRKTRRGKKAGEEYQQGRRFNSTAAA